MFSLIRIESTAIERLERAEGNSVVANASGEAGRGVDGEVYGHHGMISRPSKKTIGIRLRLGSRSFVLAAYTYGVDPPAREGATKVYSTNAAGVEQGSHLIDDDGKHVFNEGTKQAARKDDEISSTMVNDAVFWTWIAAAGAALSGIGVAAPIPTSLAGKITEGTSEVLLP